MSDIDRIKKLIKLLEESDLKKLHMKEGEFEVMIEKADKHPPPPPPHHHKRCSSKKHKEHIQEEDDEEEDTDRYITSPMVGTFYSSPTPDQPAFVKKGDHVNEDTVVCIIEAMKVMNEVKAGVSGTVIEVLEDNARPVEFGTKLFRIE